MKCIIEIVKGNVNFYKKIKKQNNFKYLYIIDITTLKKC